VVNDERSRSGAPGRAATGEGFADKEPPSFNSRLTPVVPTPAFVPNETLVGSTTAIHAVDTSLLAITAGSLSSEEEELLLSSERIASVSIEVDSARSSGPFQRAPEAPPSATSVVPRSRLFRSIVTKVFFLAIFGAALAMLVFEASVKLGHKWPSVHGLLAKIH
jgi:hypothetical protein